MEHNNVSDMVKDSGLAFRDTVDEGRVVFCPVCVKFRVGEGSDVIKTYQRLFETRKSIARRLGSLRHKQAMEEE